MSIAQFENRTTTHSVTADTDLLRRLRIALSLKRRAGWHLVSVSVRNGHVQLAGTVPTFYDRQLIAALVRHVAGVYGIDDQLTVGDPSIRQQLIDQQTILQSEPATKAASFRDPFGHVPVLTQSLDEMLAGTAANVLHAS